MNDGKPARGLAPHSLPYKRNTRVTASKHGRELTCLIRVLHRRGILGAKKKAASFELVAQGMRPWSCFVLLSR